MHAVKTAERECLARRQFKLAPLPFFRDLSLRRAYIPDMATIEAIRDDFAFLDEWEDRYRYVIDLGAALAPFPDESRIDAYKVRGCVSQVWLTTRVGDGPDPVVEFQGDSDAHIVRGLIAILLDLYSGRTPREVLDFDARAAIQRLGLSEALSSQRSNGLNAMIQRIRADAAQANR